MKKVFLLVCFLISVIFSFSQTYPQKQGMGNDKTLVTTTGSMQSTGYVFGYYSDTVSANAAPYLKYTPNILITVGDLLYKRNQNATGWVKIGGAGSTNTSIGLGFPLAVNNTNDVKKLYQGYGIKFDSTSVVQSISTSVDTSQIATQYKVSIADSINSLTIPSVSALRSVNYQNVFAKMKSSGDKILVTTNGYYNPNDGGGAQYYFDDTAMVADNGGSVIKPTSISSLSPGRWKLKFYRELNVKQFGAKGDGITDDRAAFVAAIAALPRDRIAFNQYGGSKLIIPPPDSTYYLSDSILIDDQIYLDGQSFSMFPFTVTKLEFATNKSGFVMKQGSPSGGNRGSVIKNISILSKGRSTDTTKHGFFVSSIIYMENVQADGFGGNGIFVSTDPPHGGNANISYLLNCNAQNNGLNGIALSGGESSACLIINPNCQFNGRNNILDNGFLGSTILGGHTSGPGQTTGLTSQSWVSHGGKYYIAKVTNTGIEPGVTSGWQLFWEEFNSVEIPSSVTAWSGSTTYQYAANYAGTGESQAGLILGLYREGGGGREIVKSGGTMIIGGDGPTTHSRFGVEVTAIAGYTEARGGGGFRVRGNDSTSIAQVGRDFGLGVGSEETGMGFINFQAFEEDTTARFFPNSNTNLPRLWFPLQNSNGGANGSGRTQLFAGIPILGKQGILFTDQNGSSGWKADTKRMLGGIASSTVASDGSYYGVGDQFLYLDVAASGSNLLMLRNTVAGSPGTWSKLYAAPDVSGNANKILAVNSSGNGTEWVTPGAFPSLLPSHNAADSMVVWNPTSKNIGYRPIQLFGASDATGTASRIFNSGGFLFSIYNAGAINLETAGATGDITVSASRDNLLGGTRYLRLSFGDSLFLQTLGVGYDTTVNKVLTYNTVTKTVRYAPWLYAGSGGGGGSPAGSNTELQYNNSGSFGATTGLNFTSSKILSVPSTGSYRVGTVQAVYIPDQTNFTSTLILGNAGSSLSHVTGTDGQYNLFAGFDAGRVNTIGTQNTFVGAQAGYNNTTGYQGTFVGFNAGVNVTDQRYDTYVGFGAGRGSVSGTGFNTAIGSSTLTANTTGYFITAIGVDALHESLSGIEMTALGVDAGYYTQGSYGTYLGKGAGRNGVYGDGNIVIGYKTMALPYNYANRLNIGNFIFASGLTAIDSTIATGKFGVGVLDPLNTVDINGDLRIRTITLATSPDSVLIKKDGIVKYYPFASFGGGGGSPTGNFGNIQINRNGAFATGGSDSLNFVAGGGLSVKGYGLHTDYITAQGFALKGSTSKNNVSINNSTTAVAGDNITQVGDNAGTVQTSSAANNNWFGFGAGASNTDGANNSGFGVNALTLTTTGSKNLAFGTFVLDANTTGEENVGIGHASLSASVTASYSTGVGALSLNSATDGLNTGVGAYTLYTLGTGSSNTAIGSFTAMGQTAGSFNTTIGSYSNPVSLTGSGQLNIGNVLYGINLYQTTSQSSTPTSTGAIGIRVGTPLNTLDIGGDLRIRTVTLATSPDSVLIQKDGIVKYYPFSSFSGSGTVTSFTFTDGNGFDGTVTNSTSTPTLSLTTTVTNNQLMYSNSGAITGDADLLFNGSQLAFGSSLATNVGFAFSPTVSGTSVFGMYARPNITLTSNGTAYLYDLGGTIVEQSTGNSNLFANVMISTPTVTSGAQTVTATANLYVSTAMSATVSGTNWTAYFEGGPVYLGGVIRQGTNTTASSSTPTPNADATNIYTVTALAADATFGAPTGTPVDGQSLIIRIKDNGTIRNLAWNSIYREGSIALPTTTVASETMYLQFIYNSSASKWDFIGYTPGFAGFGWNYIFIALAFAATATSVERRIKKYKYRVAA